MSVNVHSGLQSFMMWSTVIFAVAIVTVSFASNCVKRESPFPTGKDAGHYCVCNATHCDDAPIIDRTLNPFAFKLISSSKHGLRYKVTSGIYKIWKRPNGRQSRITVDRNRRYQTILGFGGSITDSAGYNIKSLSNATAHKLLQSYFGPKGSEYNFIRTPMGGSDFSLRPYSYAMTENDTSLRDFHLADEDYLYKIPYLKLAKLLSRRQIHLLTAPWTASPWMKTKPVWNSSGKLRKEYWQLWADYFVRYFEAYRNEGLEFWGTSPQNEPMISTVLPVKINGMPWSAEEERDWVIEHLVPTLRNAGFENIKIVIGDDGRIMLPDWPRIIMGNNTVRDAVYGTAIHWYFDGKQPVPPLTTVYPPTLLDDLKQRFPEKEIMYTEACSGVLKEYRVILGSWQRGENYATSIIETMSHWVSSWIDWNMALDLKGGPSWIENYIDSPIIVNATADEFYKQPMYYALGHFSKYVTPKSVRIHTKSVNLDSVDHVAFTRPDRATVLVMLNKDEEDKHIFVDDVRKGGAEIHIPPKSIHTMIYW